MKSKPTKSRTPRAVKTVRARVMLLLHEKSGAYSDYTLQPDATDAHFAKMAAEHCNRTAIISKVSVIGRDPATEAAMVEQGAKAISEKDGWKWSDNASGSKEIYRSLARAVLTSLNLIGGGK
jgi:hypothetical protein